ncbi:MAG TPA: hypothetical protein VJH33_01370 [Candidatus Paceibacterota bacterium]
MTHHPMPTLNDTVMEIELVLISVVEGLALAVLAENSLPLFHGGEWQYIPYVLGGLLFIFVFWSQAIIHLLSFIRWPLSITHTLFYFLAGFIQVIAFGSLTNPLMWFFWCTVFSVIVAGLYMLDLKLLRQVKLELLSLPGGEELFKDSESRHRSDMFSLVPVAILFNGVCFVLLWTMPAVFLEGGYHVVLGVLQTLFSAWALYDSARNFRTRSVLISRSRE